MPNPPIQKIARGLTPFKRPMLSRFNTSFIGGGSCGDGLVICMDTQSAIAGLTT